MTKVTITTPLAVPYQVELFDALSASGLIDLRVLYDVRFSSARQWDQTKLAHEHLVLDEVSDETAFNFIAASDLVVFSGYSRRRLRALIARRDQTGKPWAFWGERPGFKVPQWIGRHYRRAVFPQFHHSHAAIWGIGTWALDAYRRELGTQRIYCNVPYVSRLDRYLEIDRSTAHKTPQRILFSGSLIPRKGVDLLVKSFADIAGDFPQAELHLLGDGPLRERLQRQCQALGNRVTFHGFQQWDELPDFYAFSDILCAPSRYDGWGLIVPEGLAAGLLVISTDRTGSALDLIKGNAGWVVQAGAHSALTQALREALSVSGEVRSKLIEKGREKARLQHVDVGVRRIVSAIQATLDGYVPYTWPENQSADPAS